MATILIDKNIMVPMRGGVHLGTDVYRLEGTPSAPVLLARTPYSKEHALLGGGGFSFNVMCAVQHGYLVVSQDVRGRFASEGTFHAHFQERDDGVDAIAWPRRSRGQAVSSVCLAARTLAAPNGCPLANNPPHYGRLSHDD